MLHLFTLAGNRGIQSMVFWYFGLTAAFLECAFYCCWHCGLADDGRTFRQYLGRHRLSPVFSRVGSMSPSLAVGLCTISLFAWSCSLDILAETADCGSIMLQCRVLLGFLFVMGRGFLFHNTCCEIAPRAAFFFSFACVIGAMSLGGGENFIQRKQYLPAYFSTHATR